MEKKKKKQKETLTEDNIIAMANVLEVGELKFQSSNLSMIELANLVVALLRDKNVKLYLGLIKSSKINGADYAG